MLKSTLACAACITTSLLAMNAHALSFGKTLTVPIASNKTLRAGIPTQTEVVLMDLQLTSAERDILLNYHPQHLLDQDTSDDLPVRVDLGMNNVPVLNQGQHGTCVTFAETAAVDAVIGKGDYFSPLCSLELGKYLEKHAYFPSGWDGSLGPVVLDQFMRFGLVTKEDQAKFSCGGMVEYPTTDKRTPDSEMNVEEFQKLSHSLNFGMYWVQLMSWFEKPTKDFVDAQKAKHVYHEVKKALNKGHRVTFGTFLIIPPKTIPAVCTAGACASYRAENDTWALTSELDDPKSDVGGHEMVITGYDDKAVAVDHDGVKHTGLFLLRNSWGTVVGDEGNFYMTYDYFKRYAGEAQVIVKR